MIPDFVEKSCKTTIVLLEYRGQKFLFYLSLSVVCTVIISFKIFDIRLHKILHKTLMKNFVEINRSKKFICQW